MREISNFKFQISDLEFQGISLESQISDLEFEARILESEISNPEIEFSNPEIESSNPGLRISGLESGISNLKFQIEDFKIGTVRLSFVSLCLCICLASLLCACGYHAVGTASTLPPGLKVIAVPAIENQTNRYRVEQRMTEAVVHEFLARTKYRIVSTGDSADAVLHGQITSFEATPAVFDTTPVPNSSSSTTVNTQTARVTTMLVSIHMKVWLEERETKKMLYRNDNYLFRQPYEISTDSSKLFDEQDPALDRMSRDFASRLVADILENF
jgi:hypothetical protein